MLNRLNVKKTFEDWENRGFAVLLAIMFFYYGYRLFALTPWYDELYTYYYFISRGPVYAAIHWPLPNNHVGYSVLSGFLDLLGNAAIGLRGISFCAALANLVLLYVIGRKHFRQYYSLCAVLLYISMNLVNQLAVQGRGYTLGVTCYLTALLMMEKICLEKKAGKRYFIIFALALTLGLYVIPSNVYWVVPLCFAGGAYLLLQVLQNKERGKELRRLAQSIGSAAAAAVMTVTLYGIIWLAIGSNLLSKEAPEYLGQSHLTIITKAPVKAISTGIDYMLATPYIQSEVREGFGTKLYEWFLALFDYFQGGFTYVLLVFLIVGIIALSIGFFRKTAEQVIFMRIYLLLGIIFVPIFLIIQCKLPYYRVFSFMGVLISYMIVFFLQSIRSQNRMIPGFILAAVVLFTAGRLSSGNYTAQYSMREYYLQDALEQSGFQQAANPCVTDCTQQYLIKYLYGVECENQEINGSDFLLLDKKMIDPDFSGFEWEFYHYYNTIPWEYVNNSLEAVYENEEFVRYKVP